MTYMGFHTRDEIGLRKPRSRSTNIDAREGGVTAHYAGPPQKVDTALAGHDRCLALWRGYQRYHMDSKGWVDIAYTMGVCQHGYLLAGRGAGVRTAANGTKAGNDHWYAICWIGGGDEKPTKDAIDAFWTGVRMLRSQGDAGTRTNKHKDHKSTSCPGNFGAVIDAGEVDMANTTPSDWAKEDWQWALDNGLMNPPDHKYPSEPKDTITKEEFVAVLRRYDEKVED